jgi:hypothetical protein
LLRSLLLKLVDGPLEFQSLDVEMVAECLAPRCSWRVSPPRLLVVLVAFRVFWFLPLLDEALQMFVGGWFGWLFQGPDLRPLGMSLRLESPFHAFFGRHFVGVLSNSQMVGANVGARSPKANEPQRKREKNSGDKR